MAKINTHGLKMIGLKKVAGESKRLPKDGLGYLQINYDRETGRVFSDYFYGVDPWWTVYPYESVVTIGNIRWEVTMQTVADGIYSYLKENGYYE